MDVFCKKKAQYQACGHSSNLLNSIRYCFSIKTGRWHIYGIGLWMGTTMTTTSNITMMYRIYTIMSNATSISIASVVSEGVITSSYKNLGTQSLLIIFLSWLTKFFRLLLAYLKNFSVFCTAVVHYINYGYLIDLYYENTKITDEYNCYIYKNLI